MVPHRSVVVVEASDLLRLQAYSSFASTAARTVMQQRVFDQLDALVGALLKRVDFAHDAVLVVGASQRGGPGRLTVASLAAPGVKPGLAVSSWTRHSGIVSIVDIGPTILDQLGIEAPSRMEGRPIEYGRSGGSFDDRYQWMVDTNKAAQFRDREIPQVTAWFVVLQILLTALALVAFVRFGRRAQVVIEIAALTLLGFLAATYLAGMLPFYRYGAGPYWLFLFGVGLAIALLSWFTTDRAGVTTLIVALSIVVGLIVVDVATGSRLQFNTVFGYSPTVAGRFAGLGNLGYSQLAAGTVLLAGLVAYRVGGRKGVGLAIVLMLLAIVIDGAPFFGADVGGVLSMVPAYAVTATLLLGWKIRWRLVALVRRGDGVAPRAVRGDRRVAPDRQAHPSRPPGEQRNRAGWLPLGRDGDRTQVLGEHRDPVQLDLDDHAAGRAGRHRLPDLPGARPDARSARAHPAALGGVGRARDRHGAGDGAE